MTSRLVFRTWTLFQTGPIASVIAAMATTVTAMRSLGTASNAPSRHEATRAMSTRKYQGCMG